MDSFLLKNKEKLIGVGRKYPIRVNCNVGVTSSNNVPFELKKIDAIFASHETSPDLMMDLSVGANHSILSKHIIENYNTPIGIVPIYSLFDKKKKISKSQLIDFISQQAELGIAFFTLHLTANLELLEIAKKERRIPITSRGGAITFCDTLKSKTKENILLECLDEIILLAHKYDFAISLGTTFRPASIYDACDTVHLLETKAQLDLCKYLQKKGIKTIVENIGHIDLKKIQSHSKLLNKFNAPIMPLGPLPIDSGFQYDHIASAIGASFAGYYSGANIINCITSKEHTNAKITIKDTLEGIKVAKIAARCVNVLNFKDIREKEYEIYYSRAKNKSCILNQTEGCSRCSVTCPLNIFIS